MGISFLPSLGDKSAISMLNDGIWQENIISSLQCRFLKVAPQKNVKIKLFFFLFTLFKTHNRRPKNDIYIIYILSVHSFESKLLKWGKHKGHVTWVLEHIERWTFLKWHTNEFSLEKITAIVVWWVFFFFCFFFLHFQVFSSSSFWGGHQVQRI